MHELFTFKPNIQTNNYECLKNKNTKKRTKINKRCIKIKCN